MAQIKYKGALVEAPLPGLDDVAGEFIPDGLPTVIDAHVHLFPDWLFKPIWQWFDAFGWPVRYQLGAERIIEFLTERGVERIVGLHYAHKPGVARQLNQFMQDICRRHPQVVGTATVYPGESDAEKILANSNHGAAFLSSVLNETATELFELTL